MASAARPETAQRALGRLRLIRGRLGAAALALLIAAGAANAVYRSTLLLADAGRWARLGPKEARRRTFGPAYTDAVAAIRRTLPSDAWYLLVPPPRSAETGWELWVRYDLAPRRPILVQRRAGGGLRALNGAALPKWVRWTVLPGNDGAPLLLTREEALARLRAHGGR